MGVDWVLSKKEELKYENVILFGHSCGAHMASLLMLSGIFIWVLVFDHSPCASSKSFSSSFMYFFNIHRGVSSL